MFASIVLALVLAFKQNWTKYIAPVYAFLQGVFLFGISCFTEQAYPGIVVQAITVTFLTVFSMAILFKARLIRATEKFKAVILTATFAIMIFYLVSLVLMFVFHVDIPYFSSNSILSIVINIGIAIVAALNLVIDFDFIEKGEANGYPAEMEWYGAFGLLVTVIWLYIEILRVITKIRSR
jgi:uncharacterized YccA/Bax inhibitor family protein